MLNNIRPALVIQVNPPGKSAYVTRPAERRLSMFALAAVRHDGGEGGGTFTKQRTLHSRRQASKRMKHFPVAPSLPCAGYLYASSQHTEECNGTRNDARRSMIPFRAMWARQHLFTALVGGLPGKNNDLTAGLEIGIWTCQIFMATRRSVENAAPSNMALQKGVLCALSAED